SRTSSKGYIEGPPELIAEISHSSRAFELRDKRLDYARYGVCEYLVWSVEERQLRWFDLKADRELQPAADDIIRINVFPGLWIDRTALLNRNYAKLLETLNQGLAAPEHAHFVRHLAVSKTDE